ncbi:putative transcription factor ZF-HD family [Medicago truncatula]|uniref:Putative transcription factor ZF-HD family n=1 Tax=Medicago truncatula TaxID=3880 RepID=I3STT8_MEDTR|nr:unknown [Medicago truncatula]RHN39989.1 putative transcription factor ZF-HD family [Medicago truncatula]
MMRMLLKKFVTRYKRFSTKFTHEQRKKVLDFAMILGWKIKTNYQNVVEEFCNNIVVKCHVFKVCIDV